MFLVFLSRIYFCKQNTNDENFSCQHGIIMVLFFMPKKIRELIKMLEKAGYVNRGGKGSHRNFSHPQGRPVTLSGNPGDDAKRYQERVVEQALEEIEK